MEKGKNRTLFRLIASAMLLAAALVLPFLTGQIPQIGSMLCPMHLPVLLCGFICGPLYGFVVGLIAPLLRFVLFGMPPLLPTGIPMCFELAAYGLSAGLFYRLFPKKAPFLYLSLILSMLVGRAVWGIAKLVLYNMTGSEFGWAAFMTGAFVQALPGILAQLFLVPILVLALKKAFPDTVS